MRITLVVPGLLSLPADALAHEASLARIASLAAPVPEPDLDAAVLADLALPAAPAPLAALGAGVDIANRWAIRADPVTMVVGREDARLEGCVHDLRDAERELLLALLNAHFAPDGLVFAAPRADAWFAVSAASHAVDTTSVERAAGRPLRGLLPGGPDAAHWRRWLTEAQMLLHDHALADRAGGGVDGLWFSGGGVLPDVASVPRLDIAAAPGRNGDLLRGVARLQRNDALAPGRLADMLGNASGDAIVIAVAPLDSPRALERTSRELLGPALDALARRSVSSVRLIAGFERGAASWHARGSSWLARWTRRRARFVAPPFETDR